MFRYLLITYDLPPSGGMAAYYRGLVSHFPKDRIAVLTVHRGGHVEIGVPVFRVQQGKGISRYTTWYDKMKEIYRQFPFDVILCGNFSILSHAAFLFHECFGIPYFLFFHGDDILRVSRKKVKLNPAKRLMHLLIFHHAAGIVTNSFFTKGLVEKAFPLQPKPSLVLHPGVTDEFLGIKDRAKPFSKKIITLLTVAHLGRRKGIHVVIRALNLLAVNFPDIRYEVVGMGEPTSLENLIRRMGLEGLITLRGFVNGKELMDLYRNADLFVMPSLYGETRCEIEGFGTVFLEANAFALPVVGSPIGGIPEALLDGRTGRLLPHDFTEEDVANLLKWMIVHKEESIEMGRRGYERVNRDFTYAKQASELISFTERAIGGQRS